MNIKTTLQKEYHIEEIVEMVSVNQSYNNTNSKIITRGNTYFLREYLQRRTIAQISIESDFLDFLKENKFPCIPTIKTNKGRKYIDINNKRCALFPWRQKENYSDQLIESAICLAQLHNLSNNYKRVKTGRDLLDKDFSTDYQNAKQLFAVKPRGELEEFQRYFDERINYLIIENNALLSQLNYHIEDKPIIHSDFIPRNISYNKSKIYCVYDFDGIREDVLAVDLAVAISNFCVTQQPKTNLTLDIQKLKQFTDAYSSIRPIEKTDISFIPLALMNGTLNLFFYALNKQVTGQKKQARELLAVSKGINHLLSNKIERQLADVIL